ncbi:MAG TPA: S8 family serine peptidase [Streptosporangiaceae bacterium]|nr:S8 family serine peptidase [Streptosporangiaceae bacterium]
MTAIWVVAASAPALADQTRHQQWWLSKLSVSQAWRASRGKGITVAVLSDGINSQHADLARSVTVGPDYTNTNETASTYVGLQGTPIASLIAGHGSGPGGASGIIGVAPQARILSVRVTLDVRDPALDSATTGADLPGAIANGIRYAVHHGAQVIDLPLDPGEPDPVQVAALPIPNGSNATTPPQLNGINAAAGGSTEEAAAVAYALRHKVVLIAPAGDNANGTDAANYPAAYRGVISVGGFGQKFVLAPYSNRQSYVTLTAPGEDVIAANAAGGYQPVNSTTAASAIASGVAALIRSRFPQLSVAQVRHAMTSSTVFRSIHGMKDGAGFGTLNAERALSAAAATAAPASTRAGSGSLPLARPPAPAAPTVQSDALKPRVLRAGLYAGGVLVILLLLIVAYAVLRRRRKPEQASQVSDWNPNPQPAYSPYGSGDPDRMAEFFAAPANAPVPATGPFPQFQSTHFQAGQAASAQVPAAGLAGAVGADGDGRRVGAWMPVGSGGRGHSKPPPVSGRPPWEPASKPDSELPWAAPSGPRRATPRPASASPPAAAAPAAPAAPPAPDPAPAPAPRATPPAETVSPARPAAAATPAAPSPTGLAWEDLTDSSMTAIRDSDDPPAPAASAAVPHRAAPAPSRPRSPSGSDWERPDTSEPATAAEPAQGTEAPWESGDSDAYRPPADTHWQAPGSGARWRRNEPSEGRRTRSSSGTHRKTPGRAPETQAPEAPWPENPVSDKRMSENRVSESRMPESQAPEAAEPSAIDAGNFLTAPPPDPAWPAPDAAPSWDTGESDNRWPTSSEAHWQSGGDSAWPASPSQPPWAPAKWGPPAADPAPAQPAEEDPLAWRPGASTETFPAVSEDS